MTGDAGWAGVIANAWMQPPGKPIWIIFTESQSTNLLSMMAEATALLPENRRWQATFSTYCTNLPPDVDCRVRCVVSGSEEARMAIARGLVIDLTKPMPQAVDSPATHAARTGHAIGGETARISSPPTEFVAIQGEEIDLEEEYKVAGTALEQEYQLEGLSSIPPAMLPPRSNIPKRKIKTGRTETSPKIVRNRILLTLIACFGLLLISGVGGSYIWVLLLKNNQTAITLGGKPPTDESPNGGVAATGTTAAEGETDSISSPVGGVQEQPSTEAVGGTVAGDDPVPVDVADRDKLRVAQVTINIGESEMSGSVAKRTTSSLELNSSIAEVDQDDPNIELHIVAKRSILIDNFVAGTTLEVSATEDLDETKKESRKWSWERETQGDGDWTPIANASGETYEVSTDDYSHKIRCKLEYASSAPGATTTVSSNPVSCYPRSTLTIKYDDLIKKNSIQDVFATVEADSPHTTTSLREDTSYSFLGEKITKEGQKLVYKNFHIKKLKSVEEQLAAWRQPAQKAYQEVKVSIKALHKILMKSFKQVGLQPETDIVTSFLSRMDDKNPVVFIKYSEQLNQLLQDIDDVERLRHSNEKPDENLKKKKANLDARLVQNASKYRPAWLSASNPESRLAELALFRNVFRDGKMEDGKTEDGKKIDGISIAKAWENLVHSRNRLREALVESIKFEDQFDKNREIEVTVPKGDIAVIRSKGLLLSYPIIFDLVIDSKASIKESLESSKSLDVPDWYRPTNPKGSSSTPSPPFLLDLSPPAPVPAKNNPTAIPDLQ